MQDLFDVSRNRIVSISTSFFFIQEEDSQFIEDSILNGLKDTHHGVVKVALQPGQVGGATSDDWLKTSNYMCAIQYLHLSPLLLSDYIGKSLGFYSGRGSGYECPPSTMLVAIVAPKYF